MAYLPLNTLSPYILRASVCVCERVCVWCVCVSVREREKEKEESWYNCLIFRPSFHLLHRIIFKVILLTPSFPTKIQCLSCLSSEAFPDHPSLGQLALLVSHLLFELAIWSLSMTV